MNVNDIANVNGTPNVNGLVNVNSIVVNLLIYMVANMYS